MDEMELVASSRADLTPTADTVASHRDKLRTAIAAEGNGHGDGRARVVAAQPAESVDLPPTENDGEVFDLTLGRPVTAAPPRRRGRILAVAAAVGAVTVLGAGTLLATRDDAADLATSREGDGAASCGTELPFSWDAPEDFEGPIDGPFESSFAFPEPAPDQFVQHWVSATGSIELRWPENDIVQQIPAEDVPGLLDEASDAAADDATPTATTAAPPSEVDAGTALAVGQSMANDPIGDDMGFFSVHVFAPETSPNTSGYSGRLFSAALGEGNCGNMRITVTDGNQPLAEATFSSVLAELTAAAAAVSPDGQAGTPDSPDGVISEAGEQPNREVEPAPPPVVMGQSTAGELRAVFVCEDVNVPNQGGPVEGAFVYSTPAGALAAFLGQEATLLQNAYVEYPLPDGSFGYVRENNLAEVVTVVHVEPAEGGWTVVSWEASGC